MKFLWINRARDFNLSYRAMFTIISLSLLSTVTEVFGIGMFLLAFAPNFLMFSTLEIRFPLPVESFLIAS